jgi:hypothetical protein
MKLNVQTTQENYFHKALNNKSSISNTEAQLFYAFISWLLSI